MRNTTSKLSKGKKYISTIETTEGTTWKTSRQLKKIQMNAYLHQVQHAILHSAIQRSIYPFIKD